jgi:hypothetical protein
LPGGQFQRLRQAEQAGEQALQARHLVQGEVHRRALGAGRGVQGVFDFQAHRRQRVADLVGQPGGQAPEGGHAFGLRQLLRQFLVGRVLAAHAPVEVVQRGDDAVQLGVAGTLEVAQLHQGVGREGALDAT